MEINEEILKKLCQSDLFSSLNEKDFVAFLNGEDIYIKKYNSSDIIYSADVFTEAVGFVLSGSANVLKKGGGLVLGKLNEGDVFGFQSLFLSPEYFANEIIASGVTQILYISKKVISFFICEKRSFSLDYIRYLSKRIYFLNCRIANFTGGSAESRLAQYLINSFGDYKTYILDISLSQLAMLLDISRASLYRALDSIILSGAVSRNGKLIRLLNKDELIAFIK